jgi:hypothetical protein
MAIFGNQWQSMAINGNPDNQKLSFFPLDCGCSCLVIIALPDLQDYLTDEDFNGRH